MRHDINPSTYLITEPVDKTITLINNIEIITFVKQVNAHMLAENNFSHQELMAQ